MIITCASCLTKYYLDDSRISVKGAKVRCSRCKHVFYIPPPLEIKGEVVEELAGKVQKRIEIAPIEKENEEKEVRGEERVPVEMEKEEERFLFSDSTPQEKNESFTLSEFKEEDRTEIKEVRLKKAAIDGRRIRRERKTPSRLFVFVVVIILLVFGLFYIWTKMESDGKLSSYFEDPIPKIVQLWERIRGAEKKGLIVKDLTGYEEKVGELSLYVIEGKVDNQSQKTKKHIKVKVVIFDQNRTRVAEKEALCGRAISREELKSLSPDFFSGEMIIQPKTEKEMVTPSGKAVPFMVLFKDLPAQAKEFNVEIIEASSL